VNGEVVPGPPVEAIALADIRWVITLALTVIVLLAINRWWKNKEK
jgi:hypothetical protein